MSFCCETLARVKNVINTIFNYIVIKISIIVNQGLARQQQKCNLLRKKWTKLNKISTFTDLVEPLGYPIETHEVTTEDGYILTLHRIPQNPKFSDEGKKDPVLFLHGLSGSSEVWVMNGSSKDFAFATAESGYDVWFINVRGNFYSRKHKELNPDKDKKFWQFSFHEYSIYDTASAIDKVLEITHKKKLFLIGHSMGAMLPFVLLSTKPEYNDKVDLVVSLAPGAIFTHPLPQPARFVFGYLLGNPVKKILKLLNYEEVVPRNLLLSKMFYLSDGVYQPSALHQRLIFQSSALIKNSEFNVVKPEDFGRWMRHLPQGTSLDTLYHFRQIMMSGKFSHFDYGPIENVKRYNSTTPPLYKLDKITAPVIIYHSSNDPLITDEDVAEYLKQIPNARAKLVSDKLFGHHEFVMTNNAKEIFGNDVIKEMERYS